ncbi:hypothetical protein JMUB7525_27410 [Staphylococcus aureus]
MSRGLGDVYKRQKKKDKFFQAEDGIRDLRMSRGLGDVYKRQMVKSLNMTLLNKLQKLKHHRKHNYKTVQNKLKFWAVFLVALNYRNS